MDKTITTLVCYGNLYLSDQLDIDEWIFYAQQFKYRSFQFYASDGKIFADYLAQWFESQKKQGVKQFYIQHNTHTEADKNTENEFPFIYRDHFSIVCRFEHKEDVWSCCYPKTIATSLNLNLENRDSYAGHNCRPTTYVLTKTTAISAYTELPTDWAALKTEIITSLNQLWPVDNDKNYYYAYHTSFNEYPWKLPTLPADKNLIIPHQLLIGLNSLNDSYKNDTHPQNDSGFYTALSADERERFEKYGKLIKAWIKKVLLLASLETRWKPTPDKEHQLPIKNVQSTADITLVKKQKTEENSRKSNKKNHHIFSSVQSSFLLFQ